MTGEGPTDAVTVRELAVHDASWSAALHKHALHIGLFPALGPRFLRRYHRSFIDSTAAVALVACVDGVPAGFVVGVLDSADYRRDTLRRHGPAMAALAALGLLSRPSLLLTFVRTRARIYARFLWRQLRPRRTGPIAAGHKAAVLSHIAVDDSRRGCGLGAVLVDAFVTSAASAGADAVTTATVGQSAFYESLGWTPTGAGQTFDGATQHLLQRRVAASDEDTNLKACPPVIGRTRAASSHSSWLPGS